MRPGAATKFARFVCPFALFAVATALAQNPVPLVNQPLLPDAVAPGGSSFTLAVNGTGFISGAVVNWDGTALVTTFVSRITTNGHGSCARHCHRRRVVRTLDTALLFLPAFGLP